MDELMKVPEIAARLRKATKTVYHHIETGVIPASLIIRVGQSIRMRPADLEKLIETKKGSKKAILMDIDGHNF